MGLFLNPHYLHFRKAATSRLDEFGAPKVEEALRTAALWLSRADALLVLADAMEKGGGPEEPWWGCAMVQELGINLSEWHSCIFLRGI